MKVLICVLCIVAVRAFSINDPKDRIVNGDRVQNGRYPFAAAIYITHAVTNELSFCGGTLLTNSWVITAAHCLESSVHSTSKVYVLLGVEDVQDFENAIVAETATFILHEQYVFETLQYDLAFIKFASPIQFTDKIQPVDFLGVDRYEPHVKTMALGWGMKFEDDVSLPDFLYHVQLETISNAECMRYYGAFVADYTLCGKGPSNEGICRGDSGGPLVEETADGKFILVGVTSFYSARGCDTSEPSGFVRISEFTDLIRNITGFGDDTGSSATSLLLSLILLLVSLLFVLVL